MTRDFQSATCVWTLNETEAAGDFAADEDGNVTLTGLAINDLELSRADAIKLAGADEIARIEAFAGNWWGPLRDGPRMTLASAAIGRGWRNER